MSLGMSNLQWPALRVWPLEVGFIIPSGGGDRRLAHGAPPGDQTRTMNGLWLERRSMARVAR